MYWLIGTTIVGIVLIGSIFLNMAPNYLRYYELWDIIAKGLAAILTFIAGCLVYLKYEDEKNRQFFEARLKIYAQLYSFIITNKEKLNINGKYDFGIRISGKFVDYDKNGDPIILQIDNDTRVELLEVINNVIFKNDNIGYITPKLLVLVNRYKVKFNPDLSGLYGKNDFEMPTSSSALMAPEQEARRAKDKEDLKLHGELINEIVIEIVNTYEETIKKIGLK